MTDPRPEHVDALAALIDHRLLSNPASRESTATTILTTDDPAALDAMEDALVRAGRLTSDTYHHPTSPNPAMIGATRLTTRWRVR